MSGRKDPRGLTNFLQAIRVLKSSADLPDSLLFKPYLFAGSSYYNLNDLDSAQFCYRQAEVLITKFTLLSESERLYNKLGVLYYEIGDYKKSIEYFEKALSIVENRQPANIYFIVNYKNNIASSYRKLRDFDHAMAIYKSLLMYHINQNELMHNIGVTYLNVGNYRDAIGYLGKVSYSTAAKFNDFGLAYLGLKQFDSAGIYLQKALDTYRRLQIKQKNLDYGITLKYTGDLLMAKLLPHNALRLYQQAIVQIDPDFNDSTITKNPVTFQGLHNSFFLFDALVAKAEAFRSIYLLSLKEEALVNSINTFGAAINLAQHVEKTYNSDEAKLFLGTSVSLAYKEAIDLNLQLYELSKNKVYLQQAFNYIENSKAAVLQSDLHELSLESLEGLPKQLINEEKNIKANIARFNIQLSDPENNNTIDKIHQKIVDLEIKLSVLQDKLDQNPKYYQLKFDRNNISLDSMQQKVVGAQDAILSFYYLKNKLLCFYITKEAVGYSTITLADKLQENIILLRKELNSQENQNRKIIQETTKLLFNQLIAPVFGKIKGKKHLAIIPHNEISFIPFEIFTDPANGDLLVNTFAISYNYSVNFLMADKQRTYGGYQVLALAPFTTSSTSSKEFPVLTASRAEVESLNGKILLGEDATKRNFMKWSSDYPVIHLATHAAANDTNPVRSYIAFYGSRNDADSMRRLYEQEIFHLNMHASRLVILSACETGNGQLVNGEGIMSLSRAFSYAGCQSVITSLWKADDVATAFISKKLHHYLQKGMQKDEALQRAKTDYLESDDIDPNHKIFRFWAHLVLIGDTGPINEKNTSLYWIITLAIIFIVIIIIAKRPRTKKVPGWEDRFSY